LSQSRVDDLLQVEGSRNDFIHFALWRINNLTMVKVVLLAAALVASASAFAPASTGKQGNCGLK
jgi:hypothetical protein